LHCGEEFDSYIIEWRVSTDKGGATMGFWCCPTPGCDGKGFGFDIFPLDPDYLDENGDRMWSSDRDEDEDSDEDDDSKTFDSDETASGKQWGRARHSVLSITPLWHGLLTVPLTDRRSPMTRLRLHVFRETFGRVQWHGQETVPQRRKQ